MKIINWILRKSNWSCDIICPHQFRGGCYKTPPVDIVPYLGGVECRETMLRGQRNERENKTL